MDFRYGAVSRSVTVFSLKTRFIITSAAILTYFVNANLKFSAILHGKLNSTLKIFSKGHVIVYSLVCPYLKDWISNLIKSVFTSL